MAHFVPLEELFKGRHFDQEIVVLCVRWLSEFQAELSRSSEDDERAWHQSGPHHHSAMGAALYPGIQEALEPLRPVRRWLVANGRDICKGEGRVVVLYRAVDKAGKTVEFYLSRNRDVNAAKAFLRRAMLEQRMPTKITLDANAASHRAVADLKDTGELPKRVQVRSNKYLNNLIEQDHRRVKQRLRPMLGLKSFRTAAIVISGIELVEKIRKGQYKTGKLCGRTAMVPEVWQAALAA